MRQRGLGRVMHQQMNVVRFSVEFHEISPKIRADHVEGVPQLRERVGIEHPAPILRNKDQMGVEMGHHVPASA